MDKKSHYANEQLQKAKVENFGERETIRGEGRIHVKYYNSLEKIDEFIGEMGHIFEKFEKEKKVEDHSIYIDNLGRFGVEILYYYNYAFGDYSAMMENKQEINKQLLKLMNKLDIVPYGCEKLYTRGGEEI